MSASNMTGIVARRLWTQAVSGSGVGAEEHRELCRQHLRLVVSAGYNPMKFFDNDYKKYFYLAELYSLIDLSSVSSGPP